jgi:WD40 repeat protein
VEHHKRLVPLVYRQVEAQTVPETLADLQWILFREQDDFEASVQTLIKALDTDLEWVKAHTRLLTRTLEWDRKARDKSLLLRGSDLKNAEEWLAISGDKEPKPTDLQGQYILASRQGERKRQRFTLSAVTAGLVIALALAAIAFIQYRLSEERGKIALSRQLAAQADNLLDSQPDLALLLSVEAVEVYKERPTVQARGALLEALQKSPHLLCYLWAHKESVKSVAFSPDGKTLASGSSDKTIMLWDVATHQPQGPPLIGHRDSV